MTFFFAKFPNFLYAFEFMAVFFLAILGVFERWPQFDSTIKRNGMHDLQF